MDFEQKYQKDPGMNRVKQEIHLFQITMVIMITLSLWNGDDWPVLSSSFSLPSSSCFRGNIIPQHDSDETLLIRDPETRANSDGRTNGTSHLTEVADAEEAEKEEVHTRDWTYQQCI